MKARQHVHASNYQKVHRTHRQWHLWGAIATIVACLFIALTPAAATITAYSLSQAAPFNQYDFYPVNQAPPSDWYRPVGEWVGRLILPNEQEMSGNLDWAWIELYHTPDGYRELVGKTVRLEWSDNAAVTAYANVVTTDMRLGQTAERFQQWGNVVPTRLDGRKHVGPMQSLAGYRPENDIEVRVTVDDVSTDADGNLILQARWEPQQITGRFVGLVQILKTDETIGETPEDCPGNQPCPSDVFRVRHYNPASQAFDGLEETLRIPQQPRDPNNRFLSTPKQLESSPVGELGWYVYGAQDESGLFTVQALKPRSLHQLVPDQVITDRWEGLQYIKKGNWENTPERKGEIQSVLLQSVPDSTPITAEYTVDAWEEGDRALVMHLFGGIGGENGEPMPGWTVTGHFAFGMATVIRDPFTDELQFDIWYQQIYAHNPNAIAAGSLDWTAFTGNLQRGWLGIRPTSDVIIKLDALTSPLNLGDTSLSFLDELLIQTQIMAARYRTGDGTGVAAVTPATSCVQDSAQALYIALKRLEQRVLSTPELKTWIDTHPDDPEAAQFYELASLAYDLKQLLLPRDVVRSDWNENAAYLAGISGDSGLHNEFTLSNALQSWHTMLPRAAYDSIGTIFLTHGASLWFLRTNQVGGYDASVEPVAPTTVFGQIPPLATVFNRAVSALLEPVRGREWFTLALGVLIYGAIALPLGFKLGFLRFDPVKSLTFWLKNGIVLFFWPSLVEEFVFRVALLPHITEITPSTVWLGWAVVSIVAFILYHPINARLSYPPGRPTFYQVPFLVLCGLLGVTCTIIYGLTGSIWMIALAHWIVLLLWFGVLGGWQTMHPDRTEMTMNSAIDGTMP